MSSDEKAKILIVDDLAENLMSYQAILEELSQDLILARSGEEALKEVLKHDFAVILLDVNMAGLDGLETAALIRKRKRSTHTPIIFLTAFTDEVRIAEGYAHGFYAMKVNRLHHEYQRRTGRTPASRRRTPYSRRLGANEEKLYWFLFRSAKGVGKLVGYLRAAKLYDGR